MRGVGGGEREGAVYELAVRAAEDERRLHLLTVSAVLRGIATESCTLRLAAVEKNSVVPFSAKVVKAVLFVQSWSTL